MKKVIALLSCTFILLSFSSCNKSYTSTNKKTENNNIQTTETTKNKYEFDKAIPYYEMHQDKIIWNEVKNADGYYITINDKPKIKTTNTYYDIPNYEPGNYAVLIEPYDNENIYFNKELNYSIIKVNGFNKEEAKKIAANVLKYSMVTIDIKRYNETIFGINTDEKEDSIEGVICKKNGQTYFAITFSDLLSSGINYKKTEIKITDAYGNIYIGTQTKAAGETNNILSVISFTNNSNSKELPTVNFAQSIGEIEHAMLLSKYYGEYYPLITTIDYSEKLNENGYKSKYQVILTNHIEKTKIKFRAVFDENYDLLGIAIFKTQNNEIRFLQTKEVAEYILESAEHIPSGGYVTIPVPPIDPDAY